MTPTNLDCFRGEAASWSLLATKDNVPIDLTGGRVWMNARRNYASPIVFERSSDALDGIVIDDQNANPGKAVISLDTTDTESLSNQITVLVYNVWVQSLGLEAIVVATGTLTVNPSA